MSDYLKAGYRLVVLLVLVFAAMSLTARRASAIDDSCQLACFHAEQSCFNNICQGLAHPAQLGCREECISEYNDCLASCP
jgi:hypothetical protein